MKIRSLVSHTVIACTAVAATVLALRGDLLSAVRAQPAPGQRITDVLSKEMTDVSGRVLSIRLQERDPGSSSVPHRHPGSHTVGYILEGTYEVKLDDGPVRTLRPGETFYEYPNALHAISRNPSTTEPVRYLVRVAPP